MIFSTVIFAAGAASFVYFLCRLPRSLDEFLEQERVREARQFRRLSRRGR